MFVLPIHFSCVCLLVLQDGGSFPGAANNEHGSVSNAKAMLTLLLQSWRNGEVNGPLQSMVLGSSCFFLLVRWHLKNILIHLSLWAQKMFVMCDDTYQS